MAKERGRADRLAGEAWAAGCRDVQAAINWATARGEIAGRPFQAAFRQVLAAQDAAPAEAGTPPALVEPGVKAVTGRGKRGRDPAPAPVKPAAPTPDASADGPAMVPAEFIADLKDLRRLLAKYGKKGLADLVALLGG
jgi:hypothetical protein